MSTPEDTCVVTVTYGTRHEYVEQLCVAAAQNHVGHVVVVDNGSDEESARRIQQLAARRAEKDVTVITLPENRGSATGFATGLRHVFQQTDYPYLWCLDDDNIPEQHALAELIATDRRLRQSDRQSICLASLRRDQPWLWRAAHGESATAVFLRPSSFCGFHLADAFGLVWGKLWRKNKPAGKLSDQPIRLRFAPYGGLWMPTRLLGEAGFPDERLVLYHDDTEFTSRLVQHGAELYLVPTSRVNEAEVSWAQAKEYSSGLSRMLLSDEELRIFYNTRNKVFYETHRRDNSRILLTMNEIAFWVLLYIVSARYGVPARRQLIQRAVLDGKRAILGQDAYPLKVR